MPATCLRMEATADVAAPEAHLEEAARVLARGGVVALPTETVYGLAVRADDEAARRRLAQIKGRDGEKPLAFLLPDPVEAVELSPGVPPRALPLLRRYWPGPLTLVVPGPGKRRSTGLRVPAHPVAREILARVGAPVVATSANAAGEPPLVDAGAILASFGEQIDLIVDAGPSPLQQSSTVVKLRDSGFTVLREGIVSSEMVRAQLQTTVVFVCTGNTCRSPIAEAIFRRRLAATLRRPESALRGHGFEVLSAGTAAYEGAPAAGNGVTAMRERGLDTSGHLSRAVDRELMARATLVVALSPSHRWTLEDRWPEHVERITVLDERGVPDPIGGSLATYRQCAEHIDSRLEDVLDRLFGDPLGRAVLAKLQ